MNNPPKELTEIEKAYGGCRNCYGKGYSTIKVQASRRGYVWDLNPIHLCSCDRGKQIEELRQQAFKQGQQDLRKAVEEWAEKRKGLNNWQHSKGSHSDDPEERELCSCLDEEKRVKKEVLNDLLAFLKAKRVN